MYAHKNSINQRNAKNTIVTINGDYTKVKQNALFDY